MGREVRMVTPYWQHPKDERGIFQPLSQGYEKAVEEWDRENEEWKTNPRTDCPYENIAGKRPDGDRYMPDFEPGTDTHYMMYETCSEGTPISPAFATPEELARWLADQGASTFADMTASYETWLRMIKGGGWAPSMVIVDGQMKSGVEAVGP